MAADERGAEAAPASASFPAGWKGLVAAALAGAAIALAATALAAPSMIRAYLLDNPEIIPEAMTKLEQGRTADVVAQNRAAFETPFAGAWAGAPDGDVVLVTFFDYACGYCRASNADIDRLLKEDPKLKVVWRDWPVLGDASVSAAEASLAAARAGRYRDFYADLFARGRPTAETIAAARAAAGVPEGAVAAMRGSEAARQELGKNYELARAIGATGTPTFVVGDQVLEGAVGYEALRDAVAEARKSAAAG